MSLALEARAMKNDILIGDTPKATRRRHRLKEVNAAGRLWKHSTIADIQGLVSDQDIADFFVFTLVRNPWDRMVSYYHWLRHQRFDHQAVNLAKSYEFAEFLHDRHTLKSIGAGQYQQYMLDQSGIERCSLFARIEHLENDLAPLEAHLGFAFGQISRSNQSDRDPDYRVYYGDDDAALVGDLFATDINRFGYTF